MINNTQTDTTNVKIDQSNNIEIVNSKPNEDSKIEYENSVTEKENTLLGSFDANNHVIANDKLISAVSQENGKTNLINSSDFIIENKNGHQGYSITNIM